MNKQTTKIRPWHIGLFAICAIAGFAWGATPGRHDAGVQMACQASWTGDIHAAGVYCKTGVGLMNHHTDNTETGPLGTGGGGSTGNWTFTANDADRSASGALTLGAGGNATSLTVTPKITASGGIFTEAWREIGAGGQPTFGGSVANVGGRSTVAFAKDAAGFVHLKGNYTAGLGGGSLVFTLPAGYRPQQQLSFAVLAEDAGAVYKMSRLTVDTTGDLTIFVVGNTANSLDGLTFSVQ